MQPGTHVVKSDVPEPCHPVTGALLGSAPTPRASYRPGRRLAALVRARDGRCRFPGCSVAARFCDLDHVRPWPTGPTTPANLTCLCRRHHRVKQRPGWSVRLHPDARAVWTDPTGRVRTTWPRDLLDAVVLPATADPGVPVDARAGMDDVASEESFSGLATGRQGRFKGDSGDPWHLETLLDVLVEHHEVSTLGGRRTTGMTPPREAGTQVVGPEPHRRVRYVAALGDHRCRRCHRRGDRTALRA